MKKVFLSILLSAFTLLFACKDSDDDSDEKLELNQVFENGWPSFSINYPSGWVEIKSYPNNMLLIVEAPGGMPSLAVNILTNMNTPFENAARVSMSEMQKIGRITKVVSEKKIELKNGMPAHESEYTIESNTGEKLAVYSLIAAKRDCWIQVILTDDKKNIKNNLKEIAYSLKIEPGGDKPADLPADMQKFVNKFESDFMSRDIDRLMENYSDRWHNKGINKQDIMPIFNTLMQAAFSFKIIITQIDNRENRVFVSGYFLLNGKKSPYNDSYIKEKGQWKCYGNIRQKQM